MSWLSTLLAALVASSSDVGAASAVNSATSALVLDALEGVRECDNLDDLPFFILSAILCNRREINQGQDIFIFNSYNKWW